MKQTNGVYLMWIRRAAGFPALGARVGNDKAFDKGGLAIPAFRHRPRVLMQVPVLPRAGSGVSAFPLLFLQHNTLFALLEYC